jgi:hypothetical protein
MRGYARDGLREMDGEKVDSRRGQLALIRLGRGVSREPTADTAYCAGSARCRLRARANSTHRETCLRVIGSRADETRRDEKQRLNEVLLFKDARRCAGGKDYVNVPSNAARLLCLVQSDQSST